MSSDEDNARSGKRKRRSQGLPDSPASTSSGSPIIGSSYSHSRRRRNLNTLQESSDSNTSANSDVIVKRRKVGRVETDSDFSSDGDSSPVVWRRLGRNLNRPLSESSHSEESVSGSDIIISRRRIVPLVLSDQDDDTDQWETDFSDSDDEPTQDMVKPSTSVSAEEKAIDSDSSDGLSEKCAICLVSFRLQEVGIPENCEHNFCLECLEEWSKNMNTCPVDRIEYHSITVKKFLNGKVLRKIPIERPERQEDAMDIIVEDPTFCEICHSDENEDRILLCDGCDLGYHLYCLTPPLEEVPEGNWYCVRCSPVVNQNIDFDEVYALMREASDMLNEPIGRNGNGRRPSRRLIPRTRQSERVRQRVEHNRNRRRQTQPGNADVPSTSTGLRVSSNQVSSSSATRSRATSRKKHKKSKRRSKTVWVLNEFGEAVATKKRVKSRKKRRSKKAPRRKKENLTPPILNPQAGSSCASAAIKHHRYQGGVPALDLFGSVNVLDFTESEDEGIFNESEARGVNVALASRPSIVDGLRRTIRRKATLQEVPTVSSSTDILDNIMQSQETLLSKNSVISVVDSSGKIVIESKKKASALNNNSPSKPDFNSYTVKETPWHGRNYQQSGYRPHNRNNWSNNRNNWQHQGNYNNYNRQGGQNFYGQGGYGGQGRQQHYHDDIPQDYTQRTLCEAELQQDGEDEEEPQEQHQEQEENQLADNSTSEADVDIYGDIETEAVSTSNKIEEDYRPPSPQPMQQSHTPNTNTDEDCDSESGMVIDTERGPDEPVSSTVALDNEPLVTYSPGQPTASPEDNPQYSPGEPTGSPGEAHMTENSQNVSLDQLKSGLDELQREFTSGLMEFQMNMTATTRDSQPEVKEDEPTSSSVSQEIKLDESYLPENVEDDQIEAELANLGEDESEDVSPSQSPGLRSQLKPGSPLDSSPAQNEPILTGSVTENLLNQKSGAKYQEDDELSDDGCPNFSIYSKQSKSVALTTDLTIRDDPISDSESSSQKVTVEKTGSDPRLNKIPTWNLGGLYSDSEDESVVKKTTSFGISDIKDMTEDILSEEERSYTPVLDERCEKPKKGFDGLDTEMISDDDRNDFDESHELKTVSDGDALEINAKESELDFTRPDEFEEGEIVDKHKEKPPPEVEPVMEVEPVESSEKKTNKKDKEKKGGEKESSGKKKRKEKEVPKESNQNAEENANKENVNKEPFKKLTKSNKERNYRDKDRDKTKDSRRSRSPETSTSKREESKRKKEKRKELARYNVRAIIAEKPRAPPKDQFGRDIIRRSGSRSRSRSYTPPLAQKSPIRAPSPTVIPRRHSPSPRVRTPPRGGRSPVAKRRSTSRSREKSRKRKRRSVSPSGEGKRDRSKTKKRKRSISRSNRGKKPKERGAKKRARRSVSHRRRSVSPRRRREWTPSLSRSLTPPLRHPSPSWTPPRVEPNVLRNQNLTVIVNNDAGKKKKDKRNKEKRRKDDEEPSRRRRRDRERTPPPSKEVFASGDNILVSVSFNNDSENRDVTRENRKRKEISAVEQQKKNERREKRNRSMVGVKPVAIIDLERSPFQEIISSPKDVIVLSDSDNNETESNRNVDGTNVMCDSSQQVASPEQGYSTGPKTPPEPSVKFALMPKPQQMRAINNPLHDPLEHVEEEEEESQNDLNNSAHKGPNTPPEEPPTSPPSSPDAYDPFEPTKSRSPTPEPEEVPLTIGEEHNSEGDVVEIEKPGQTPDVIKSLTPPVPDIQPADSQSSIQEISESKSPEDNRPNQQTVVTKPIAQTVPFSPAAQPALAAVIPVSSTVTISRINILSSAMLTPAATIPQRAAQVKPNPVKISPTKVPVKSTPIKPMQSKIAKKKQQNGNNASDETVNLDFDSPYSPGSSDYEDLFEPPTEPTAKAKPVGTKSKSAGKKTQSSAFDTLFGSPTYNKKAGTKKSKRSAPSSKIKHVGVKVDEDSLKILEDLPNSAVEMQVKDKFLKKLNRQERVVEEVKLVLKPFYNKKKITKDEYKDIMRRAVPKICHNKNGEINPIKIRSLIEAYVKKVKHSKKVTSSSQKVV